MQLRVGDDRRAARLGPTDVGLGSRVLVVGGGKLEPHAAVTAASSAIIANRMG